MGEAGEGLVGRAGFDVVTGGLVGGSVACEIVSDDDEMWEEHGRLERRSREVGEGTRGRVSERGGCGVVSWDFRWFDIVYIFSSSHVSLVGLVSGWLALPLKQEHEHLNGNQTMVLHSTPGTSANNFFSFPFLSFSILRNQVIKHSTKPHQSDRTCKHPSPPLHLTYISVINDLHQGVTAVEKSGRKAKNELDIAGPKRRRSGAG